MLDVGAGACTGARAVVGTLFPSDQHLRAGRIAGGVGGRQQHRKRRIETAPDCGIGDQLPADGRLARAPAVEVVDGQQIQGLAGRCGVRIPERDLRERRQVAIEHRGDQLLPRRRSILIFVEAPGLGRQLRNDVAQLGPKITAAPLVGGRREEEVVTGGLFEQGP